MTNFDLVKVEKTAFGSWSDSFDGFVINYSDILTKLIQETGRWCERYASDLFTDWERVLKAWEKPSFTGGQWIFAMRADGIDNLQTIKIRMTDPCYGYNSDYYRAIWGLNAIVENDTLRLELGKIDIYSLEKAFKNI